MNRKIKQRQQQQPAPKVRDDDGGEEDELDELAAATTLLARLDLAEHKLRLLLLSSISSTSDSGTSMAAVDYFLSTLISELEAEQILSIEDLFGVIQNYVPENLLRALAVEDEDDMEVLVSKLWSRLLKENVIPPQEDEEVGVMGLERRGDKGCELCARVMPLTRHHLRPRTLHKKLLKQGISQEELNICATICRPCHTAVHRSHDNDTLATLLYTVPALLEDEKVGKFVRWASKQRGRAQQDGHNQQLRYQR
ncbi:Hypothetical protein NocV09_04900260 [Nannochloropsis oceanica]